MRYLKTIKNSTVTLPDLYRGMETSVALIDKYGEAYWPIFEWLEAEINDREGRAARLDKFRQSPYSAKASQS